MCVRYLRFSKILKLILLSLFINLIFTSVCFATVNMVPSTFNKSDIDVYEYLVTQTFGEKDLNEPSTWNSTTYYNNYQSSLDILYASSYTAFTDRGFDGRLYVICSLTDITFGYNGTHTQVDCYGEIKSYYFTISTMTNGKLSWSGATPIEYKNYRNNTSGTNDTGYVLAYTTNGWYEMDEGSIKFDDIITPPGFTPLYDHVINVSGIQDNVYNFNEYLGGVPDTTSLGSFTDNFDDFIVDVHLNKFWNLTQSSLIARSTFYNSYYGSGVLSFNDNKEFYINDRYLEYDTLYCLMIYVYKDYQSFSER